MYLYDPLESYPLASESPDTLIAAIKNQWPDVEVEIGVVSESGPTIVFINTGEEIGQIWQVPRHYVKSLKVKVI